MLRTMIALQTSTTGMPYVKLACRIADNSSSRGHPLPCTPRTWSAHWQQQRLQDNSMMSMCCSCRKSVTEIVTRAGLVSDVQAAACGQTEIEEAGA